MSDLEKLYESLYANNSKEQNLARLEQLAGLYRERKTEFDKASRNRWILTFAGFAVVFMAILLFLGQTTMEDIREADIEAIGLFLLSACSFSFFHMLINVSIFGWLFQRNIVEERRLDDLKKEIDVLIKLTED